MFYADNLTGEETMFDWSMSNYRKWMNNTLINIFPDSIKSAIVAVPKHHRGLKFVNSTITEYTKDVSSRDKVWLPSFREVFGTIENVRSSVSGESLTQTVKLFDNNSIGKSYAGILTYMDQSYNRCTFNYLNNNESYMLWTRDAWQKVARYNASGYNVTTMLTTISSKQISSVAPGSIAVEGTQQLFMFGFCL